MSNLELSAPRFAGAENVAHTMSSLDLRAIINDERVSAGESKVRNDQFVMRVEDEIGDELGECKIIAHPQSGVDVAIYQLTLDQCMLVSMRESKAVRRKVLERLNARPSLPTYAETLRLYANQIEQTERVTVERDRAIATKAQIGNKREATAMATASAKTREAAALRDQLGFTSRHATILHVEHATGGSYDFVGLRRWCKANGISAEVVPDKRFPKGVKAWPAGAWLEVYGIDLAAVFGGGRG